MFPPLCMVLFRFALISAIKSELTSDRSKWDNTEGTLCTRKSKYLCDSWWADHDHDFDSVTLWNRTMTVCPSFSVSDFSLYLQVKGSQLEVIGFMNIGLMDFAKADFFGIKRKELRRVMLRPGCEGGCGQWAGLCGCEEQSAHVDQAHKRQRWYKIRPTS